MKLMQNELFIGEIWAKIAIGRLFYLWKTILAIGSKSGRNLTVGSWYYHWIKPKFNLGFWIDDHSRQTWRATSGPLDQHGRDLGRQIKLEKGVKMLPKNRLFYSVKGCFSIKLVIYRLILINRRYIDNFFIDFYRNFSSPIFLHKILCRPLSIHDISSMYPDIFLLDPKLMYINLC